MRPGVPAVLALFLAACGGGAPPMAPSAPPPAPPAPAPTPATTVLRRATIMGANGHSAGGTVEIVQNGALFSLELRADFRIDTGSIDLYLANQRNGVTGADLNLGDLRALTGAQSYAMPNDGAAYPYILLWCRPFRVPIGIGELR